MEQRSGFYGQVPNADVGAVAGAARYIERDWGENYRIGLAGTVLLDEIAQRVGTVFQVCSPDGSRFLVWADRYGNCGQFQGESALAFAHERQIEAYT